MPRSCLLILHCIFHGTQPGNIKYVECLIWLQIYAKVFTQLGVLLPCSSSWSYINLGRFSYISRIVALNAFLGILLIFFTTPSAIWSAINSIPSVNAYFASTHYSHLVAYIPILIMLLLAIILPYVLIVSSAYEGHRTKSILEHSRLVKTYFFLIFFVLILPVSRLIFYVLCLLPRTPFPRAHFSSSRGRGARFRLPHRDS